MTFKQETRSNYEKCASEKIGSVTDWLQKVASGEQVIAMPFHQI